MEWLGVDRQRLGTAMLAFGIVGLLLAALVAVTLVAGFTTASTLNDRIVTGQDRVMAALTDLTLTMDSVATSVDHGATTLSTSRDSVAHAVDALGELAGASDSLASSLDISLFGQRPFTTSVAQLHDMATRVRTFQDDATRLAGNLSQDSSDTTRIASQVRDMRTQVAELSGAVTGLTGARDVASLALGGMVLAALLTLWLAVLAGAIAWAGMRLRRHATLVSVTASSVDAEVSLAPAAPGSTSELRSASASGSAPASLPTSVPTSTWAATSASASISPLDTTVPATDEPPPDS